MFDDYEMSSSVSFGYDPNMRVPLSEFMPDHSWCCGEVVEDEDKEDDE